MFTPLTLHRAEIPNVSRFKAHGAGGEGAGIRVSKGEALSGARILVEDSLWSLNIATETDHL